MIFNHVNVNKFETLEQITREDGVRFYQTPSGNRYPSITTMRKVSRVYLNGAKK